MRFATSGTALLPRPERLRTVGGPVLDELRPKPSGICVSDSPAANRSRIHSTVTRVPMTTGLPIITL